MFQLAQRQNMYAEVKVQNQVTRNSLIQALQRGQIVDVSCHGSFQTSSPLQSALNLARGGKLALSDVLSQNVDLRELRLLILSACQTAILDMRGARDQVRSLAVGMLRPEARRCWPHSGRLTIGQHIS